MVSLGLERLDERGRGRWHGAGLVLLHPGQDRGGDGLVVDVLVGEVVEHGERDLGFGARLADQADDRLGGEGAGVAEQALVDVADLLDVDVAERDRPPPLPLDVGHLDGVQHLHHHPVIDRQRQWAAVGAGTQEREAGRVEQGAAVGGQAHVLEGRAVEERPRGGE